VYLVAQYDYATAIDLLGPIVETSCSLPRSGYIGQFVGEFTCDFFQLFLIRRHVCARFAPNVSLLFYLVYLAYLISIFCLLDEKIEHIRCRNIVTSRANKYCHPLLFVSI